MPGFRISLAAKEDVKNIGRYTQDKWGVAQRRRYLDGLNATFVALSETPEMAAERREFSPPAANIVCC